MFSKNVLLSGTNYKNKLEPRSPDSRGPQDTFKESKYVLFNKVLFCMLNQCDVQFLAFCLILFHCNHPPINTFFKKSFARLLGHCISPGTACHLVTLLHFVDLGFLPLWTSKTQLHQPRVELDYCSNAALCWPLLAWPFKRDAYLEFRHLTAIMFLLLYVDYVIEFAQLPYDIKNYFLHFQKRNLNPRVVR